MSGGIGGVGGDDWGAGYDAGDLEGAGDAATLDEAAPTGSAPAAEAAALPRPGDVSGGAAPGALAEADFTPVRRLPGDPGDVPDPELPTSVLGGFYASWKGAPLVRDGYSPHDIAQGSLGDCFLLSAMSAAAHADPDALSRRITDHGDGTYTVRFHEKTADDELKAVDVKVDADLPVDPDSLGADAATFTGALPSGARLSFVRSKDERGPELWPSIVEKAYARWKGGYDAIANGGFMHESITALTGHDSAYVYLNSEDEKKAFGDLAAAARERRPVLTSTRFPKDGKVDEGLVEGHAYTLMGTAERDGKRFVTLRNPWGRGEPGADGTDDGVFEMSFEAYRKNFDIAVISTGKPPQKAPASTWRDPFSGWNPGGG
jgi:hypothetical protein